MKNTFVKVLSFLMALTMIVGMFSAITVSAADECAHTNSTVVRTVAPTCQTLGYTEYECADCGKQYTADVIMPSEEYHNIQATEAVAASCTTNAFTAGEACVVEGCGYAPEGSTRVELLGTQKEHTFSKREVAATCKDAAKTEYVCSTCTLTAEQIQKKGYAWVGTQTYDAFKVTVDASKPATDPNHDNLVWSIVTAPVVGNATTACTAGSAKGVCASCGFEKTATLPAPHDFANGDKINPTGSPCAEYKTGTYCANCGAIDPDAVKFTEEEKKDHFEVGSGFDGKIDATSLPKKADGSTIKLSELAEFGLKVGDELYIKPTCTQPGKRLIECACGKIDYVVLPVEPHRTANGDEIKDDPKVWDNIADITWTTLCTEISIKIQQCATCEYKITDKAVDAPETAHKLTTVIKYATCCTCTDSDLTCEHGGYTYEKCTNTFDANGQIVPCSYKTDVVYTDALDHNLGPVVLKEGAKCTDADGYIRVCQNVDQNNVDEDGVAAPCGHTVAATKPANAKHSYSAWETVPGTCHTESYQKKTCSVCKDVVYNDEFEGELDENNHEYTHKAWVGDKAPTCTQGATEIVECEYCGVDTQKEVAVGKTEHNKNATYAEVVNNRLVTYTAADSYPATCKKNGYKMDGQYCTVCGYATKAATVIKSDKTDLAQHTGTKTLLKSDEATCKSVAYAKYNTSCCGIVEIYGEEVVECEFVKVDFTAPTCTKAGTHAHEECKWCKAHKAGTTKTTGCTLNCDNHNAIDQNRSDNNVIAALGHDFKEVKKVPETCDATGTKAYEYCTRCDVQVLDGKSYDMSKKDEKAAFDKAVAIAPHYNTYKRPFEAKDATCTAYGTIAGTWCTECDKSKVEGQLDPWVADYAPHAYKTFTVNANGAGYDCTKAQVDVSVCMNCAKNVAKYKVAKNPNGHDFQKYTVNGKANQEWSAPYLDTTVGANHCVAPYIAEKVCKDCGKKETKVVEAATGHWTTKGIAGGEKFAISLKCNEIVDYIGQTCGDCGLTVAETTVPTHNILTNVKKPTCDADGYEIKYCADCHDEKLNETKVLPKLTANGKHTNSGDVIEYVPATATADGYTKYNCAVCGAVATDKIPATAVLAIAGAASAEKVTAGYGVTYTVTLSDKAATFKTIKIEVKYDAAKYDFVGATSALTPNVYASADNGVVGVVIVDKADMATAAEGTELVVLEFAAKKYAMGAAEFSVNANVVVDNKAVTATAGKAAKVTVVGLGNATGTGYVTAADALEILTTEEFNAEFDINGDGMVDLIDVALVGTFAASNQTAKDYLVMLGTYGEVMATIDALLEQGRLADCNKDGLVTINDYYVLIDAVDAKLAGNYTTINFNSVEEFVKTVMTGLIAK